MKRIAFRTMGGKEIGYGHLYRCLSLAKAIRNVSSNYTITFIVNQEVIDIVHTNGFEYIECNSFREDAKIIKPMCFDLVIVDSYGANDCYLRQIKNITKLIIFDDNNDIYDSSIPDSIINGNIYATKLNYKTNNLTGLLLGPDYLVMQERYWKNCKTKNIGRKGVLMTTGGSDIYNISPKILKELAKADLDINVIVGPGYSYETISELNRIKSSKTTIITKPNGLIDYISSSEFVITAAGSTVYEVLSQKTIPIIFSIADNQKMAYTYFKKIGVQTIGQYPNIKYDVINKSLEQAENSNIENLYKIFDGMGAIRVAEKIVQMV